MSFVIWFFFALLEARFLGLAGFGLDGRLTGWLLTVLLPLVVRGGVGEFVPFCPLV